VDAHQAPPAHAKGVDERMHGRSSSFTDSRAWSRFGGEGGATVAVGCHEYFLLDHELAAKLGTAGAIVHCVRCGIE
jgi:hypothetical protein